MKRLLVFILLTLLVINAYSGVEFSQSPEKSSLGGKNKYSSFTESIKYKKEVLDKLILARQCVEDEKNKIQSLQEEMQFWDKLKNKKNVQTAFNLYQNYLEKHLKRLSSCEEFILKNEDHQKEYEDLYSSFKRMPLLLLKMNLHQYNDAHERSVSFSSLSLTSKGLMILSCLCAFVVLCVFIKRKGGTLFQRFFLPVDQCYSSVKLVFVLSALCLSLMTFGYLHLYSIQWHEMHENYFYQTLQPSFFKGVMILVILNLFNYSKFSNILYNKNEVNAVLLFLMSALVIIHFIFGSPLVEYALHEQLKEETIVNLFEFVLVARLSICALMVYLLLYKHQFFKKLPYKLPVLLFYLLLLAFVEMFLKQVSNVQWNGSYAFILILPTFVSAVLIVGLFFTKINQLPNSDHPLSKKICRFLLIPKDRRFHELFGLNYLWVSWFILYYALNMFDFNVARVFSSKVHLFDFSFSLSQLYTIALVFLLVRLFFKVLGNFCFPQEKSLTTESLSDNQSPGYLLTLYSGSLLATFLALLAGSISITGILIVLGALSVGIGIGLKSIINNLISGIILIFENAIKVGDFIQVGKHEGVVIKTGIRAMQIKSLDNIDILIPNETLIEESVEHFSLETRDVRLKLYVGVAFDSDLKVVSNILFSILEKHPDILMKDVNGKPCTSVIFSKVSDFELQIMLGVRIRDIRIREKIKNYVNAEILREFAKGGIEKPYPKHDVFLKRDDPLS